MKVIFDNVFEWNQMYGELLKFLQVTREVINANFTQAEYDNHPFALVYIFQKRIFVQFHNFSDRSMSYIKGYGFKELQDFSYVSNKDVPDGITPYEYGQRKQIFSNLTNGFTLNLEQAGLFYAYTSTPTTIYCFPDDLKEKVDRAYEEAVLLVDQNDDYYGGH